MINKDIVDEGFDFYNLDLKYKDICYKTIEKINSNEKFRLSFYNVYNVLYESPFEEINNIWNIKSVNELFISNIDLFVTNVMIIIGYKYHRSNMNKNNFDEEQINIHKRRVKECFQNDLIKRKYEGIRISQMLWAIYFIRIRIIEVGSLQFEYKNDSMIKIHIPNGTDLNIIKVKNSILESHNKIKNLYGINNFNYICNSWLLSNQIYEIIDKNTNISKFYNLFNVNDGGECTLDILNFVYGIDKCEDYSILPTETILQRKIKKQLLMGTKFYLGLGNLKDDYI